MPPAATGASQQARRRPRPLVARDSQSTPLRQQPLRPTVCSVSLLEVKAGTRACGQLGSGPQCTDPRSYASTQEAMQVRLNREARVRASMYGPKKLCKCVESGSSGPGLGRHRRQLSRHVVLCSE